MRPTARLRGRSAPPGAPTTTCILSLSGLDVPQASAESTVSTLSRPPPQPPQQLPAQPPRVPFLEALPPASGSREAGPLSTTPCPHSPHGAPWSRVLTDLSEKAFFHDFLYNLVEDEPARGPALPPYITSSLNSYPKETQHEVIRQVVQQAPLLKETVTRGVVLPSLWQAGGWLFDAALSLRTPMTWTRNISGTALRLCKQRGLPVTSQDQSDSHDDPVAEAGEASSDDDDIEGMETTLATDQPMQPTGAKNQRPANSSEHSIGDGSINTNLEAEDTSLVPDLGRDIALEQTAGDISSPPELTEYDDLATEFPSNLLPWTGHDAISAEPMLRDDSRERDEQSTTLLQPRIKDDRHAQRVTHRPSPGATLVDSPSLGLRKVPNPQSDAHEQLVTGSWLSDATLELLQNKIMQYTRNTFPESNILDCSFVFDPLFIELAIPPPAWPRRMQHPSIRFIFVPLHHREPGHWTLSMVDLKRSYVFWYDPLPDPRRARDVSRTLCSWFSPNSTPFEFHELVRVDTSPTLSPPCRITVCPLPAGDVRI
ncbi:hypothetical protein CDV31_016874 [Fusarium ambrosium]|uniref:Ubiquitin-like protease family profile domain-containing protein n=1 Tax=Fusarium ambrosium TaxID=131363 RepID=A0A428S0H8_9HYPO|nr:hypothetical protein CDV31_016874 [Fusarium ambrosium]